jgi:hypothetical protein
LPLEKSTADPRGKRCGKIIFSMSEQLEIKFSNFDTESPGWWTYPYFSCEDNLWLISFAIPIVSKDGKSRRQSE